MRITDLNPYVESLEASAQQRVRSSLASTAAGHEQDLVTPLIGKNSPDYGARRMMISSTLLRETLPTGIANLDIAESDLSEKIGAYSIQLPFFERREQIETYFKPRDLNVDYSVLHQAMLSLEQLLPKGLLASSSLEAYLAMPHGTNLGAPFFTRDKEFRPRVLDLADRVEADGFERMDPCMLYWRGQPRGINELPKQRTVWGYPHYITIHELRVQMPLLNRLRVRPEFAAWHSTERVDQVITHMIDFSKTPLLSVDFSGFDASVPAVLIEGVFEVIRRSFRLEQRNLNKLIDYLKRCFLSIPLLTPSGIWTDRYGAVPSGSGLTNFVDTCINYVIAQYVSIMLSNPLDFFTGQGDDAVWCFRYEWEIEEIRSLVSDFGMELSDDKSNISSNTVHYLQNIHYGQYRPNGHCAGIRPLQKVLNGMLSYERLSNEWSGSDDTIRWLQQAETAKWHPKFKLLASLLYTGDKYVRTRSLRQIIQSGGGIEKIASDLKLPSFPYGKEPLSKIDYFEIVKEIQRLGGLKSGQ